MVLHSLKNDLKIKCQILFWDSKIKKQIIYIEHTLAQTTHYHFSRDEWRYTVEILEESKVEIQEEKLQMLHLYVCYLCLVFKGLDGSVPLPYLCWT